MKAAALLAEREAMLPAADTREIVECINSYGPFPSTAGLAPSRLAARLKSDKKTVRGKIHFVLPERIGSVVIRSDIPDHSVLSAIEASLAC
jgi:3-dehydroquinate synthase